MFGTKGRILAAAAGSPTPDWQAKVEWLEGRRFPRTEDAITEAAGRPNAPQRRKWLRQRGYPVETEFGVVRPTENAARVGNVAAFLYLLTEM
ncbi:hypothetical protein GPECTOR_11g135 [Gonium pectorale]|uniref:Uncharacterized protein n=1 Tax=Gonium pectorale TaxID=33097 RepID=A0A150GPF5_GONPE|nr:hypothetical protein GPECTOR_11g135 [Gonium pectorale]|eukprot:KXZ51684.1 hypothetical protein GPECTOR_11g135 [Gonium pectorale]